MPSVASFMMPAAKCVTAMPEDKLSSVVTSLVNEKIGCVVVVDPAAERAVGIVTRPLGLALQRGLRGLARLGL